jgi:hypothetical protein
VYKSLIRIKRDTRALNRSDLLEHRGWIRRIPNPDDRRSTLIEITPDGRAAADQLLSGIRTPEKSILSALSYEESAHLLDLLAKILTRAAEVATEQPEPPRRPAHPSRLARRRPARFLASYERGML